MEKELCNIFRIRGSIGDSWLASCKLKTIVKENEDIKNILVISGPLTSVNNVLEVYKYITFIDRIIFDPDPTLNYDENRREDWIRFEQSFLKICSKFHPESKKYNLDCFSNLMNKIKSSRLTLDEIQMKSIKTENYICLQPRTRRDYTGCIRDWTSFLKFAKIIYDITNYKSVLIGSKNDDLENIKEKFIINVAGKITIRESMQLILNSRALVGTTSWSPLFSSIFKIPSIHLNSVDLIPIFLQFFKDMDGDYNESLKKANENPAALAKKLCTILNKK